MVVGELLEGGYLDDAAFARRFAEDRSRLDGWGRDRIARRLRELGVAAEHVDAFLAERSEDEEHGAALALLRRRFPTPPTDRRDRDRALGVLVRRGHPLEVALAALRVYGTESAHAPGPDRAGPARPAGPDAPPSPLGASRAPAE